MLANNTNKRQEMMLQDYLDDPAPASTRLESLGGKSPGGLHL